MAQDALISCTQCGGLLADYEARCSNCGAARVPVSVEPGVEIFEGKWAIESKIGQGGMGSVFLASDLQLDRKVAIKTLSTAICEDKAMVARFEREAKVMAKLDHPNLVPVYAVGRHDEVPFIVMKFLEGTNLSQHLRQQGRLPMAELLHILRQLCSGLEFVHTRGFIHRDIKPANIFIAPDGHVTILDLGVAHDPKSTMTKSGATIGTPKYMSPEQVMGARVDYRSDLYALGVVLYEMLAGRAPFDGDSDFSVMRAHTDVTPVDPSTGSDLPAAVGAVAMRALAKRADDRYQSAGALYEAVVAAFGSPLLGLRTGAPANGSSGPAIQTENPGTLPGGHTVLFESADQEPAPRRPKTALFVGGVLAVVVVLVGIYATIALNPHPVAAPPPPAPLAHVEPKPVEVQAPAPSPQMLKLVLVTIPPGAQISSDELVIGTTPLELRWEKGKRGTFTFQAAGHLSQTRLVAPEADLVLDVTLKKEEPSPRPQNPNRPKKPANPRATPVEDLESNPY